MNYYSKKIIDLVKEEINNITGEKKLIKIENFQNFNLYSKIAEELEKECLKKDIDLIIKLSNGKYLEGKILNNDKIKKFEEKGWIDLENHMTNYRNINTAKETLILLLGTEMVEDRGGLEDFFLISPAIIDKEINENYHLFFSEKYNNGEIDGYEDIIDKIFKTIFSYYPKNLLKLSCIIDTFSPDIENVDDLVKIIFSRLYEDWGIPKILDVPDRIQLKKGKKINILEKAVKFTKRSDFKDLTKVKLAKIEGQLNKFEEESLENSNINTNEFLKLKKLLLNYIKGKKIKEVKSELFEVDFVIIDKILQLKLTKGSSKKKAKRMVLKGEAFDVFSKSILTSISYYLEEENKQLDIEDISITILEIGIADISELENELYSVWRNICNYIGGILSFINQEKFLTNDFGDEINLRYELGKEFFSLSNAESLIEAGILKKLPVTKKLSLIKFKLNFNKKNVCLFSNEIEWKFKNNEDWLVSFSFLNSEFLDEFLSNGTIPFIPNGTVKNIKSFLNLNDNEEFLDLLERNELDLSKNICQDKIISQNNLGTSIEILGLEFSKLLNHIYIYGFFSAINQGYLFKFLSRYKTTISILTNEKISQDNKEIIELFAKMFTIVDKNESIETGLNINIAIIPPYHPSTLEKLLEKFIFLRSGFFNILKIIMKNSNDNNKEKIINEKLRIFNELSLIQSSVDVLIGVDKKYLDTRGVYGLYSILSSKQIKNFSDKRIDYKTILKKENALTDERINYKETSNSRLISEIISDYIKVYPSSIDGLKIAFITPRELQPIISSLNSLINKTENSLLKNDILKIVLHIFSEEENIGGKSYLAYWIENIFKEDSNIDIKIYYNTHSSKIGLENNIKNYLNKKNDLIFITDLLEEGDVEFQNIKNIKINTIENKFPMVFKPLAIRKDSLRRSIELSQSQFEISTAHSKLICKIKEGNEYLDEKSVIKDYLFTQESKNKLNLIKERCIWTVCLDKGIDQHLLRKLENNNIIGFFPGQGSFGEYNLTLLGKDDSLKILSKRLQTRLCKSFKNLNPKQAETMAKNSLEFSNLLNGSRILRALNVNDYAINEYLAYLMTYKLSRKEDKCWGLIPLDFHQNWFSEVSNRPDFLKFEIIDHTKEKLKIKATLIECKLANENYAHKDKALNQIEAGYQALKDKFSPNSTLIEKRYWFAQLYKNIIYSEMLESSCNNNFSSLSDNLFKILEGEFELEWQGEIFTYWIDSEEEEIIKENLNSVKNIDITCIEVPRKKIEELLLENNIVGIKEKKSNLLKYEEKKIDEIIIKKKNNLEISDKTKTKALNIETKENLKENDKTIKNLKQNDIKLKLISNLDIQEEDNDIQDEVIYAKHKLKNLCFALRKNKVDVDPYNNDNDNGIIVGPNFIKLKLKLDIGTSISKIEKYNKDIKLWLSLDEFPIIYADKGFVAVEISRKNNLTIKLGNILQTLDFEKLKKGLQFVLGIDETYSPYIVNLADSNNPHLLIAGATGGGKSVLINSIIINLMTQYNPKELEFIFIDPKKVELSIYKGSPYLRGREVSKTSETALKDLDYAIKEMEKRYELLEKNNVKNIEEYNLKINDQENLSRILIVIDEFANFMEDKEYKLEIESSIKRISAEARAAGIHMIISTQSPRGDVITTTIRNNLGARVALRVPDSNASHLILDSSGAENLKGKGDMLFNSPSSSELKRLKSPFISNDELIKFLEQSKKIYIGD